MDLTREHWVNGWKPSNDLINGDPTGLLRSTNLRLDEEGAITLAHGAQRINDNAFGAAVHTVYSKLLTYGKMRFVGLADGTGYADTGGFGSSTLLYVNGSSTLSIFQHHLGVVFISSQPQKKKLVGQQIARWGIPKVDPPTISAINQPFIDMFASWIGIWGPREGVNYVSGNDYIGADCDPDSFRIILSGVYGQLDTTALSDGSTGADTDLFSINVRISDSEHIQKVRVEFLLEPLGDGQTSPGEDINYYWHEWAGGDNSQFRAGIHVWSNLTCNRGDFQRQGGNNDKNWSNVYAIHVVFLYDTALHASLVNILTFAGGVKGKLTGEYEYFAQLFYDNGTYVAKAPLSAATEVITTYNGYVHLVNPNLDALVPEDFFSGIYFYRRKKSISEKIIKIATVKVSDPEWDNGFDDTMSDDDALFIGTDALQNLGNQYLQSVQDVTDEIIGLVTYGERLLILTSTNLLLSDRLNPDAIDMRYTIKIFGNPGEQNFWIKVIAAGQIIVGTSQNLYEITGSLLDQPDGSLDANIRTIGEKHPPICIDAVLDSGTVIYVSGDGYRLTNGNVSQLISPELNLLFNHETRYGLSPIRVYPPGYARYPIAMAHGKLWISTPLEDGSTIVLVKDLVRGDWREWRSNPTSLASEEDGNIIGGYNDNYLRLLDTGYAIDNYGQDVLFQTISDANLQVRNRKDVFTFKMLADTGNMPIDLWLSRNEEDWVFIGNRSFNGSKETIIDLFSIPALALGFRYGFKITGQNLTTFKLRRFTIEYDPRPEQLTSLRIPNDNLGSFSRKRFTNYAGVIDTLGNLVSFAPLIDGNPDGPSSSFTNSAKDTFVHYFKTETMGTDIGGILTGGPFEFYGTNREEIVSEKLPVPVKWLRIPANNYGTPERKRHSSYKYQIDTRGKNVQFTPELDLIDLTPSICNTARKQTVEHYFYSDTIGIDIGGILQTLEDTPFEFYGTVQPEKVEVLPPRLKYFLIPPNDYGSPNRKRHSSYKFQINTNGKNVQFTPILDTNRLTPATYNTRSKQTVEYFFKTDTIGIDIGGELLSLEDTAFEFYGVVVPQDIEVLPPRLKEFRIPENNYGVAARKRIRTIPFAINTNGQDATFQPIVDNDYTGVPTVVNTPAKQTVFHYFNTDTFGIDYSGELVSNYPFEFYGLMTPENVETIPVGKLFDQIGPIHLDRIGKIIGIRVRLIPFDITLPWRIFADDIMIYQNVFQTNPGFETVLEKEWIAKGNMATICRIEFGPCAKPFHRWYVEVKVNYGGDARNTMIKWLKIK